MPSILDKFEKASRLRETNNVKVELKPRPAAIFITPFCGPEADMIMVQIADGADRGHFWDIAETLAISDALRKAALVMANNRTSEDK